MFLKVPVIIIIRFGKNVLCPKYINICMNFEWVQADVHGPLYIFCSLFKKMEKVQEHDLYLNKILHHFDLIFFFRINNKKFMKRGPRSYFFTK